MIKIIYMVITMVITSFYFFPFEFVFLPGINTKMAMAAVGLVLLGVRMAQSRSAVLNKDFFTLSLWALGVSLAGFVAVVYNDTHDYTYATYAMSMWVWAGAAYVVVELIRKVHGKISVGLVAHYLIAVCVLQCILALLIDRIPAFEQVVNSVVSGLGFVELNTLDKMNRLYGIGASLDVAGTRFSAVLVMIAFLVTRLESKKQNLYLPFYIIAVFIIGVVGNMMSRTTTVGLILFIIYLVYKSRIYVLKISPEVKTIFYWLMGSLLVLIPILIYLYHADMDVRNNLRFAFEGFFSLAEEGRWNVHSNEMLKNMYVFPDNMKTWIIGDGYFDNPYNSESETYYVGPNWAGFYQATDVGYLRFIFYFGLLGLFLFSFFMCLSGKVCMQKFKKEKALFVLLLMVNFIVWFKVSTDIFLVFALFLVCTPENEENSIGKNATCIEA